MLNFKVKQLQTWGLDRVSYKPERMATHESGKEEIEACPLSVSNLLMLKLSLICLQFGFLPIFLCQFLLHWWLPSVVYNWFTMFGWFGP